MTLAFESLGLSPALLAVTAELGYTEATAVQAACIPVLLAGRDLIGQSRTGSGKTAAFGLAILEKIELAQLSVQALVLCPTRELAAQVAQEIRKLGRRHPGLQVRTITGGEPMREQTLALGRGVHVVIGTPGRVVDHLGRGTLDLSSVRTLVLDEADRMLEMGFQLALAEIIGKAPKERQTVCFSATFPDSIQELSQNYQTDPERITIEEDAVAPIRLLQIDAEVADKVEALRWALSKLSYESALIFCNMKATVAEIEQRLHLDGASVACLHGDLEQYDRDRVMAQFRNQSVRILVATDVAARGIDVAQLDLVINFELPSQQEIYIHRIGRTGRAGKEGQALCIVSEREQSTLGAYTEGAPIEAVQWSDTVDRAALGRAPLMQTIHISGGRKDKVRPGDILGALTGEAGGLQGTDIGKIEIHDRYAYVAVSLALSADAIRNLNNGKIKGRRFKASLLR